jgi:hypothetical protein
MSIFASAYPEVALQAVIVVLAVVVAVVVNRKSGAKAMLATLVGLLALWCILDLAIYGPEDYSPGTVAAYFAPLMLAVLVPFVVIGAIVFAMSRRRAHWWPQFFFALLAAILALTLLLPEAAA